AALQEKCTAPEPAPPPKRDAPPPERAEAPPSDSGQSEPRSDEPEAPTAAALPLEKGNEERVLARLKEEIGAGNALTGVRESSALAILGPDRVELRFPAALKVAADRCEAKRPVVEAALKAIVGKPVAFAVALEAAPANGTAREEAKAERSARDASRPEPVNPEDIADPFVRRAVDLFEARQVTSQPLPPAAASASD
ncbi:hypothetical protein ACG2DA_19525, partial [Alienimonas sp. DA493]